MSIFGRAAASLFTVREAASGLTHRPAGGGSRALRDGWPSAPGDTAPRRAAVQPQVQQEQRGDEGACGEVHRRVRQARSRRRGEGFEAPHGAGVALRDADLGRYRLGLQVQRRAAWQTSLQLLSLVDARRRAVRPPLALPPACSRTRMLPESSRAPRTCAQGPAHRNIKHGAAEPVGFLDGHRPADRHRRRAGGCAASRGGGSAAAVRQRAAGEQDVLDGGGGQLPAVRGAAAETDAALQQRWPRPVGEDEGRDVRRQRWDPASSQLCAPRGASVQARRVVRARQEPQAATPGRERGGDGRRAGCLAQGLVSLCCDVEAGQRQADRLGTCRCRCGYTRGRRGARERIETAAGTVAAAAGRRRRQAADHA